MSELRRLPWITRAVVAIVAPAFFVGQQLVAYGYSGDREFWLGPFLSNGWFYFAWAVTAPIAWVEVRAARAGWRWLARCSAGVAISFAALVGTLSVWFRLGYTTEPVDRGELEVALGSYSVILLGYLIVSMTLLVLDRALWGTTSARAGRRAP